jgi:hypothetical protein
MNIAPGVNTFNFHLIILALPKKARLFVPFEHFPPSWCLPIWTNVPIVGYKLQIKMKE